MIYPQKTIAPDNLLSGYHIVKKNRERFPRPPPAVAKIAYVAIKYPHHGWKILIPFLITVRSKACMHKLFLPFKIG